MLTSLCLSARIHSQMRLNTHTHTYHCHHPQQSFLWGLMNRNFLLLDLWKDAASQYFICGATPNIIQFQGKLPVVFVFVPLFPFTPLFSLLSPSLSLFVQSLSVSVMMNHGEAVIGTALTCLLQEISVSFLPSVLCPPCLPPSLRFSLSNSCLKPFTAKAKSWPQRDVGQGHVRTNLCKCVNVL